MGCWGSKSPTAYSTAIPVIPVGFDLSKESYDSPSDSLCVVAPGVWSLCSKHQPGMLAAMPSINNRAWVLQITDKVAGDFLFVYGLPSIKAVLPGLQAIAKATGLKVKYVMSSGDWHHLFLSDWLDEPSLSSVKFFMGGVKFPNTRNGQEILSNTLYVKRIELYLDKVPPELAKYPNQMQFVLSTQNTIYKDQHPLAKDKSSMIAPEDMSKVMEVMSQPMKTRFVCAHFYHPPTKTLSTEHSFDLYWPKSVHEAMPDEMKPMFSVDAVNAWCKGMGCICDARKNWAECKEILALDVRCIVDLHVPPNCIIRKFTSQAEFVAEYQRCYQASGEADNGAELPEGKLAPNGVKA